MYQERGGVGLSRSASSSAVVEGGSSLSEGLGSRSGPNNDTILFWLIFRGKKIILQRNPFLLTVDDSSWPKNNVFPIITPKKPAYIYSNNFSTVNLKKNGPMGYPWDTWGISGSHR